MTSTGILRLLVLLSLVAASAAAHSQRTVEIAVILKIGDGPVESVKSSDLKVKIGERDAAVEQVAPVATRHLRYALLNDASVEKGWPGGTREQVAAVDLFLRDIVTDSDRGGLINFADQIYIDLQDEKDPKRISKKLVRRGSNVSTFRDSLLASAQWLKKLPDDADFRKAMFVFSDGHDNVSRTPFDELIEKVPAKNIPIFFLVPASVQQKKQGEELQQLARVSGGQVYFLASGAPSSGINALKRDLAASFLLTIEVPAGLPSGTADLVVSSKYSQMQMRAPSRIAVP